MMKAIRKIHYGVGVLCWLSCAGASSAEQTEPSILETAQSVRDSEPKRPALTIEARAGEGRFRRTNHLDVRQGDAVQLRVKAVEEASIRWYLIVPDLTQQYQNANHPWQKNPYRWIGFATIDYYRLELTELRDRTEVDPIAPLEAARKRILEGLSALGRPTEGGRFYYSRFGTFRFQVTVADERGTRRSAGLEEVSERGLSPKVFQLNIRTGDTYIGYLRSFHNVPGLFGSVISQSRGRIGADCADVLMAAWAEQTRRPLKKNYNVQMLTTKFSAVAEADFRNGAPDTPIAWGTQVLPGDFIAVSYSEDAKKYHHIGALLADENGNGILDPEDSILHAGPDPLQETHLSEGGFDGHVLILRH